MCPFLFNKWYHPILNDNFMVNLFCNCFFFKTIEMFFFFGGGWGMGICTHASVCYWMVMGFLHDYTSLLIISSCMHLWPILYIIFKPLFLSFYIYLHTWFEWCIEDFINISISYPVFKKFHCLVRCKFSVSVKNYYLKFLKNI